MFAGCKNRPYLMEEHARAQELRAAGLSYKRIAAELGISSATAHRWTRDVALSDELRHAILSRPQTAEAVRKRGEAWSARCRAKRLAFQQAGRARATADDQLHMAGCLLYWCEGSKDRNVLKMCNSDRAMMTLFMQFLRGPMGVRADAVSVSLNVYLGNGLSLDAIEEHWLEALELPRSCLRKHQLNHHPTSSSGRKLNKLPYGVCTVTVGSTELVQHIFGAIQEYAGFEEPRWLDGL